MKKDIKLPCSLQNKTGSKIALFTVIVVVWIVAMVFTVLTIIRKGEKIGEEIGLLLVLTILIIGFAYIVVFTKPVYFEANTDNHSDDIQHDKASVHINATNDPKPEPVRCPICGSTQITAVQRKWGLVMGFMTNKVDRFCLNCKHKW